MLGAISLENRDALGLNREEELGLWRPKLELPMKPPMDPPLEPPMELPSRKVAPSLISSTRGKLVDCKAGVARDQGRRYMRTPFNGDKIMRKLLLPVHHWNNNQTKVVLDWRIRR